MESLFCSQLAHFWNHSSFFPTDQDATAKQISVRDLGYLVIIFPPLRHASMILHQTIYIIMSAHAPCIFLCCLWNRTINVYNVFIIKSPLFVKIACYCEDLVECCIHIAVSPKEESSHCYYATWTILHVKVLQERSQKSNMGNNAGQQNRLQTATISADEVNYEHLNLHLDNCTNHFTISFRTDYFTINLVQAIWITES